MLYNFDKMQFICAHLFSIRLVVISGRLDYHMTSRENAKSFFFFPRMLVFPSANYNCTIHTFARCDGNAANVPRMFCFSSFVLVVSPRMTPANCLRCQQEQRSRACCRRTSPTSSTGCGPTAASRAASLAPGSTSSMTLQPSKQAEQPPSWRWNKM